MTDEKKSNLEIKFSAPSEVKSGALTSPSALVELKRRGVLDQRSPLEDKAIGQPSEEMSLDEKESKAGKGDAKRGISTSVSQLSSSKVKESKSAFWNTAAVLKMMFDYCTPFDLARLASVSKKFLTNANASHNVENRLDFAPARRRDLDFLIGQELKQLSESKIFQPHSVLLQPSLQPLFTYQRHLAWAIYSHILAGRLTVAKARHPLSWLSGLSLRELTSDDLLSRLSHLSQRALTADDLLVAKIIKGSLRSVLMLSKPALEWTLSDYCSDWFSKAHVDALNATPPEGTMAQLRGFKAHPVFGFKSLFTLDEMRENWFTHLHTEAVNFGLPIEKVRNKSEQEVLCAWLKVSAWFKKPQGNEIWQAAITPDKQGVTPIYDAVLKGRVGFLSALERISRPAGVEWQKAFTTPVNVRDGQYDGLTLLHVAAHRDVIEMLEIIRRCGNYDDKAWSAATLTKGKFRDQTPLDMAIKNGNWFIVMSMWINGGYASLQWQAAFRAAASVADEEKEGRTPLYMAAETGRLWAIYRYGGYTSEEWIAATIKPLSKGKFPGQTPLHMLVKHGHWAIIKNIWANGGSANQKWQEVFRAAVNVEYAINWEYGRDEKGHSVPCFTYIVEKDNVQSLENIEAIGYFSVLYMVAVNGKAHILEAIYRYGGYTPETWDMAITTPLGKGRSRGSTPLNVIVDRGNWAALESMAAKSSRAKSAWKTSLIGRLVRASHCAWDGRELATLYDYGGYTPETWQVAITTPLADKSFRRGHTALYTAAKGGRLTILKSMRIKGVYDKRQWQAAVTTALTSGDDEGDTPLQALIMNNTADVSNGMQVECDWEIDEWRQMINAPPSCGPYKGVSLIGILSIQDKVDGLNRLWESGRYTAPLWRTAMTTPSTEAEHQYGDQTPLYTAAMNGSVKVLEHFRVHGEYKPQEWLRVMTTPLTSGPHQGRTPLYAAALNNKVDVLNNLRLHSGCDDTQWWQVITAPLADGCDQGISPLQAAITGDHPVTWAKTVPRAFQPVLSSRASSGPSVLTGASGSSFFGSPQAEIKRAVEAKGVEEEVKKSKEGPV